MSYLGSKNRPNASHYYACNLSMKSRYGLAFEERSDLKAATLSDKDPLMLRKNR